MAYSPKDFKAVNRWSPNPAPSTPEQLPDYLFNAYFNNTWNKL